MRHNIKGVFVKRNKLLKYSMLFSMLVCNILMYGQQETLYNEAKAFVNTNPDESIKIASHLIKTSQASEERAKLNLLIAQGYEVKGDFKNVATYLYKASEESSSIDKVTQIGIAVLKAQLLRNLYIDKQSMYYLDHARMLVSKLTASHQQDSLETIVMLEKIKMYVARNKAGEALANTSTFYKGHHEVLSSSKKLQENWFLVKGEAYSIKSLYDSAYYYLEKARFLVQSSTNIDYYKTAVVEYELGSLFLRQKKHTNAESAFLKALTAAKKIDNQVWLEKITKNMAMNYLAMNNKEKHTYYNNEFLVLNNNVEQIEQEAVNTVYNLISKEQTTSFNAKNQHYVRYLYFAIAGLLFIVIICSFLFFKSENKKKRLKEIVNYLEVSRSNFLKTSPKKVSASKKVSIPPETEQAILEKLKKFEQSTKYTTKDMSLAVLAGQFDTNTKYLSEIINKHYNDNFNTFINKLRVKFIIDKLKTDPNYMHYKISFLAERAGFSSHSSFATVFKSIVGMPPATFINLLNEEMEHENASN